MRNIKLILEYDGTGFIGWQKQKRGISIQGEVERVLEKILNHKINLISSGRTDAGVHAKGQVANFKTPNPIPSLKLKKALNSLLPQDIRINKVEDARPDFNARFCVKKKIYRYYIYSGEYVSPFISKYVWHLPHKLDYPVMLKEIRHLLGRHDFVRFQAKGSAVKDTNRRIYRVALKKKGCLYEFTIEGDGFLYKMVRLILGTLVEVGKGKFEKGRIALLLRGINSVKRGPAAPPEGLFLWKAIY